jgi:CubicO group peptidase (beta-lactamase class C family)
MQVAGRIAEIASGRAWNQLFALRVAGPVGMSSTSFGVGQNPRIAGGVVSTAEDYARMLRMLAANGDIDGRRVLPAAAVQEMERDQTGGATIVYSPYIQYGAGDVRYGVGLWRDQVSPSGQLLQVSSGGAFGFMPWIDRERGIVGVFAVVDEMSHVYDHVSEIQALVRTAVDQAR